MMPVLLPLRLVLQPFRLALPVPAAFQLMLPGYPRLIPRLRRRLLLYHPGQRRRKG